MKIHYKGLNSKGLNVILWLIWALLFYLLIKVALIRYARRYNLFREVWSASIRIVLIGINRVDTLVNIKDFSLWCASVETLNLF